MRLVPGDQGSPEWFRAHIGVPSASQFHRLITRKTMKPSASADKYLAELVASWMLEECLDDRPTEMMHRGVELEEKAVAYYEFQIGRETKPIGFCMLDDKDVGCTPDRLVGDDGLNEIKCPSAPVHVEYLLGLDSVVDKYRPQCQGQLWITGRKWVDLLSFNPLLPPALIRVERDETFIAALATIVDGFLVRLAEAKRFMVERGYVKREDAA